MPAITIERLIAAHQLRKRNLEEMEKAHKANCAPIKEEMIKLEGAISKLLLDTGINSAKTSEGTAYKQKWRSVRVNDWQQALVWLREHDRWDALTHALNKTAVLEEIDAGREVPGVSVEEGWKLNIRRS